MARWLRRLTSPEKERQFETLLQELKVYKLRHKVDQTHQLWQEGSHPQMIETEAVMWQKIEYIHSKPTFAGPHFHVLKVSRVLCGTTGSEGRRTPD